VLSVLSQEDWEVTELCQVLDVSRRAYYDWKQSTTNLYQRQDETLTPMIQDVFYQHRRRYGARRIAQELTERGYPCSRTKVRKIMAQTGLVAIQPKSYQPRTTESRHTLGYNENLLLDSVQVERMNQV